MWNISDKSAKFCERIIKASLHADLFGYLKSDVLSPANITGQLKQIKMIFVQGQLGTLHNVVQKAKSAREEFRECGAVDILQPFREETSRSLQVHELYRSMNVEFLVLHSTTIIVELPAKLIFTNVSRSSLAALFLTYTRSVILQLVPAWHSVNDQGLAF